MRFLIGVLATVAVAALWFGVLTVGKNGETVSVRFNSAKAQQLFDAGR